MHIKENVNSKSPLKLEAILKQKKFKVSLNLVIKKKDKIVFNLFTILTIACNQSYIRTK